MGVVTERSDYERAGYSLPVGYGGLRAGISAGRLGYRLNGLIGGLNGLSGTANIFSAYLSQPLRRTDTSNFFAGLALDYKHFVNDSTSGNLSNKVLKTAALQFRGDFADTLFRGASNAFSVALLSGRLDLSRNSGSLALDQAGPQTQGSFVKVPWNFQRVQALSDGWDVNFLASGQIADGNLDSYEKFSLGGPTGVRAYPAGEALGDDGWLASLELRRAFNAQLQASAFLDAGHITQLHSLYPNANTAGSNKPNNYSLYGLGIGVTYGRPSDWIVKGWLASKIGPNPGRDANGKDSDGGNSHVRAWIQLAKFF
jgi:hemolysin activation/secretion protein